MTRGIGIGIDVSKDKVDVSASDGSWTSVYPTTVRGLKKLARAIQKRCPYRVVLEASGGYERPVLEALHAQELPIVLVQPKRARAFAKALGVVAKTDAIDALVLARMAQVAVDDTVLWKPPTAEVEELRSLVLRRHELITQRASETQRKRGANPYILQSIQRVIDLLNAEIARLDQTIARHVEANNALRVLAAALTHVKGVGHVTAATLLACLPELGLLQRNEIVALVGIAPMNRESGRFNGKRFIQGGRHHVRNTLYMAATVAAYHNPHIQNHFKRLRANGKAHKVAIVACMRKLLIHLNSIARQIIGQNPTSGQGVADAVGSLT